ncbi:hypothetical protein PV797_13620 [Clostridiaceae bacterium M8S5]|nr:hypothetical protein PV797_13620 [Clostridiaceae bacterium M8S5]
MRDSVRDLFVKKMIRLEDIEIELDKLYKLAKEAANSNHDDFMEHIRKIREYDTTLAILYETEELKLCIERKPLLKLRNDLVKTGLHEFI